MLPPGKPSGNEPASALRAHESDLHRKLPLECRGSRGVIAYGAHKFVFQTVHRARGIVLQGLRFFSDWPIKSRRSWELDSSRKFLSYMMISGRQVALKSAPVRQVDERFIWQRAQANPGRASCTEQKIPAFV
jgi:hypothetical protein